MKSIALIGADGQLAQDIQKVFAGQGKILPLYHRDIEIKSPERIDRCLTGLKVEIIINTAAYHQVDECEIHPEEAFAVNALGVRNLCLWCKENDKLLVHISTDYVFGLDRHRQTPYSESDLPGPLNVYGTSKLAGEYFIQSLLTKFFIIRTAGLFGISGSRAKGGNFIDYMVTKAKKEEEISVVKDQVLSPTYTKNFAENLALLLQTGAYGLYHMVSKGQCSWYEMTKLIVSLLDKRVPISPISSAQTNRSANRPSYSALINSALEKIGIDKMNTWQDNVEHYMIEKEYIKARI